MTSSTSSASASGPATYKYQYESEGGVKKQDSTHTAAADFGGLEGILTGGSIAPRLGNETAKYVLFPPSPPLAHSSCRPHPPRRSNLG